MKITMFCGLLAVPFFLTSCSTPERPPQVFHNVDNTSLVIVSLDDIDCEMIQPARAGKQQLDQILTEAHKFSRHQMAVVILENYKETQLGSEFRDRSEKLYVGLLGAGYAHVVFLQGKGVNNPDGLITLADYN